MSDYEIYFLNISTPRRKHFQQQQRQLPMG